MTTAAQSTARLSAAFAVHLAQIREERDILHVLEAGGGARERIEVPGARICVIDNCARQLGRNSYAHEKIEADLHTVNLGERKFDVVIAYDVLEHLNKPDLVVDRLCGVLKPGGVFVVASPNPLSLSGLITRLTPHAFHRFFHEHLLKSTAHSGFVPFRTYMRLSMRADALAKRFRKNGLQISLFDKYESVRRARLRTRAPSVGRAYNATLNLCKVMTLGLWAPEISDFVLLACRPWVSETAKTAAPPPRGQAASV